jgi:hypothetical protein
LNSRTDQCPISTAGAKYRLNIDYSFVSSYTNGVPWSIQMGTTTIVSGAGASFAWSTSSYTFTCGSTAASNTLTIKVQANASRAATLNLDNIFVNPISIL